MIAPLRRRHLFIWIGMAVLLPAILAISLSFRKAAPAKNANFPGSLVR